MDRLKRIEELMHLDPANDTAEANELTRLVDEQMHVERGILEPPGTVLLGSIEQRAYLFVCQSAQRMAIERTNAIQAGIQDFADFVFVLDGERVEVTYDQLRRLLVNGSKEQWGFDSQSVSPIADGLSIDITQSTWVSIDAELGPFGILGVSIWQQQRSNMTDRIHSITLILARDMRIDDAEVLLAAARQLKGVVDAMPNICDTGSAVAETRARQELGQKIIDIIYPKRPWVFDSAK